MQCSVAYKGWKWTMQPIAKGLRLAHWLSIVTTFFTHLQNIEMAIDIIRSKTYEMPYSLGKFAYIMGIGIYFTSLTTYLQYVSPNQLAFDPLDGGRAMLYILMFGTAILVLQM